MDSIILYTLCYILFSICFVFPPSEFVSVGLCVESLFSFWLKTESENFILHHVKRTVATILTHSCIPLGYILGIKYLVPEISIWDGNIFVHILVATSIIIPITISCIVLQWYNSSQYKWRKHPIIQNLKNFTSTESDINRIIRDIDSEYKSINKIIIKCSTLTRVIATDNWIIKVLPYTINIAHQSDASLLVSSSDSPNNVPDTQESSQYLNIDVRSSRPNVKSFKIRINSSDFKDLQEKIVRPVSILENVFVQGSLIDCFLKVFKEQIRENPKVSTVDNLDVCIGCLQVTPNIKLKTSCGDTTGPNKCTMCYCKPLWCEDCIGKWFASRQDQDKSDTWLSSKCTCPMCRSTFCLLDVCLLE